MHPYLLRSLKIDRANHVWATDITYIPMAQGWVYLYAIVNWASRRVLAHRISITMETDFCLEALHEAFAKHGQPEFYNTRRPHSTLDKKTPDEFYFASLPALPQAG